MKKIPDDQLLSYVADIAAQLAKLCYRKHRVVAAALVFAAAVARDAAEKRPARLKRAA